MGGRGLMKLKEKEKGEKFPRISNFRGTGERGESGASISMEGLDQLCLYPLNDKIKM